MSGDAIPSEALGPRSLLAPNPGPFTLDGTRTWIVGRRRVAVVDPGPDDASHVAALAAMLSSSESVTVLVTHAHLDHCGGAGRLARLLGASSMGAGPVEHLLADGEGVETDEGALVAVHTPGHSREHLAFHWPARAALFAGDLVLGKGESTWVGGYPGCVADYLASLARLRELGLERIYPAHGPPIEDVQATLTRFDAHRRARIAQVAAVLAEAPGATRQQVYDRVYGGVVPPGLERAALASLGAILDHLGEGERS